MIIFAPGVVCLCVGALTLMAPTLILALVASFFVFCGILFCYLAYKFLALKRKLESIASQFEGRVIVQGVQFKNMKASGSGVEFSEMEDEESEKKVIVH
jgi:membrane protein implicated in regulation of membrane protease activity